MSIPFSQSIQSLQADHGRFSVWGISLAILLLLLWTLWFFAPSLTIYTTGTVTGLTRSGTIVATFPAAAGPQLLPGQAARIYPTQGGADQVTSLPATVLAVDLSKTDGTVEVRLYPESELAVDTLFAAGVSGEVTVETAIISPAVLLMRTTGQLIETPPVWLSPQER